MPPEVLVPQSACVQAFAFGLLISAVLVGGTCWAWARARALDGAYRRGYLTASDRSHRAGWVAGMRDAGVLERLLTLEDTTGEALEARLRRHEAMVSAWRSQLRERQG